MRTYVVGQAACLENAVTYHLLAEEARIEEAEIVYGIRVTCGEELVLIHNITVSESRARALMECMCRCSVTPVTARDVVDDWLLA